MFLRISAPCESNGAWGTRSCSRRQLGAAFEVGGALGLLILVAAGGFAAWLALRNLAVRDRAPTEPQRAAAGQIVIAGAE